MFSSYSFRVGLTRCVVVGRALALPQIGWMLELRLEASASNEVGPFASQGVYRTLVPGPGWDCLSSIALDFPWPNCGSSCVTFFGPVRLVPRASPQPSRQVAEAGAWASGNRLARESAFLICAGGEDPLLNRGANRDSIAMFGSELLWVSFGGSESTPTSIPTLQRHSNSPLQGSVHAHVVRARANTPRCPHFCCGPPARTKGVKVRSR